MKIQAAEGSLWAMFFAGWKAAGGSYHFKKSPTILELEALLKSEDELTITVLPNGSIRV
jgi:hypothetical protein